MVCSTVAMNFGGQIYHAKWLSGQKIEYLQRTWTWTCCKPGCAWKPGWAFTLPWPWPKKIFNFFLQKIKSGTVPNHHVKGQPATSTYVREKGGVKKDSNRETHCIFFILQYMQIDYSVDYYRSLQVNLFAFWKVIMTKYVIWWLLKTQRI